MFKFRGVFFMPEIYKPEILEQVEDFSVRDDDVFVVTYPKSGTTWMQNIIALMYMEGDVKQFENIVIAQKVPWLEVQLNVIQARPSPRQICSHLPYHLMPKEFRDKRSKVIYVMRNPKDTLVSFYYFYNMVKHLDTPKDFQDFLENFINGQVFIGSWFEHVRGWQENNHPNMLWLTYEEMKKDLPAVVRRISKFVGKHLTEEQLLAVVKHSSFKAMKASPTVNKENLDSVFDLTKGKFMRKGKVGDWKNHFTVAQSEWFDTIYHERMARLDLDFTWDMPQ
uniref:amine sulfotransferase-like n=1 Tax=Myxine glutinosa TaxID=7769 RepID=UPI00358E30E1